MKDIRPALRTILLTDNALAALVGNVRVYPAVLPQGEIGPSIVFNRITEASDYNMAGDSGLAQALMQIDAWALKHDLAAELSNAAHDRLSGFSGWVLFGADSPQNSVNIRGIFQTNGRDLFDDVSDLFRVSRDYAVWYAGH